MTPQLSEWRVRSIMTCSTGRPGGGSRPPANRRALRQSGKVEQRQVTSTATPAISESLVARCP